LHKADRIGMHHHLEIRVPYCDYRMVEFALSLPLHLRRTPREDKRILRHVAERYLPPAIVSRPKQGFPTPLTDLMTGPIHNWIREVLTDPASHLHQWLVPDYVEALLRQLAPGKPAVARQVYTLMMLELWSQEMQARRSPPSSPSRSTALVFHRDLGQPGVAVAPVDC